MANQVVGEMTGETYTVVWTYPHVSYKRGFRNVHEALSYLQGNPHLRDARITLDKEGDPAEVVLEGINPSV